MNDLKINVNIADRPYQLKIDRNDEEVLRKAAKSINQLIKVYSENYAFKDKQDLLAMVALNYTTSALNNENLLSNNESEITGRLSELDKILLECLENI